VRPSVQARAVDQSREEALKHLFDDSIVA